MSDLVDFLAKTQPEFRKARIPSLYSDFREQRSSNPDGYKANLSAWESALSAAAKAGKIRPDTLAIRLDSNLEKQLQSAEYGRPQGLNVVEEECLVNGKTVSLDAFLNSDRSFYDQSWDLHPGKVTVKVLGWVLKQAGVIQGIQKDPKHHYVLIENVEDGGHTLSAAITGLTRPTDRIIPMVTFQTMVAKCLSLKKVSEIDLSVLLKYLSRDRDLIVYNKDVVKVKAIGEDQTQPSQQDIQICSLKTVISGLEEQVDEINQRVDDLTLKAKDAVAKKNKPNALRALKSRKMHLDIMAKRNDTLFQLEDVFHKIEEAADQVEVIKAMQGGAEALRSLNKASGGVDHVDDILDSLREEMAQVDEVSNAIRDHGQAAADIDESELDKELQQMESESIAQERAQDDKATEELSRRMGELQIPTRIESSKERTPEAQLLPSS